LKAPRESSLYPIVERWMKRHFLCFKADTNTGLTHSRVDVVGVKDTGGDLSGDVETIAIEVKKEGPAFATTIGQTLGYSVYANRVYLAQERRKPFTWEQMDIASHLGVGLIEIRNGRCKEVQSSPPCTPIPRMNLLLLDQLGLGKCQLCRYFFKTGPGKRNYTEVIRGQHRVQDAIDSGKGIIFWNDEVAERKDKLGIRSEADNSYERRFICSDCVGDLLAVQEKRIKGWLSDPKLNPRKKVPGRRGSARSTA
jgi:hypothetical protein